MVENHAVKRILKESKENFQNRSESIINSTCIKEQCVYLSKYG